MAFAAMLWAGFFLWAVSALSPARGHGAEFSQEILWELFVTNAV